MKKAIGLWIDHHKTVIVTIGQEMEAVREIRSRLNRHVPFSIGSSEKETPKDARDRRLENHLNRYYEQIIAVLREGDSIRIFGLREAKGELKKRLEIQDLSRRIVEGAGTIDKSADRQIVAKVREHLQSKRQDRHQEPTRGWPWEDD